MSDFLSFELNGARVCQGDAREVLRSLPAQSVQCVCTSPPYYSLRRYEGVQPVVWGGDPSCDHIWQTNRYYTERAASAITSEAFSDPGLENAIRIKEARWREDDTCKRCQAWQGCLGLEPTPGMFVSHLVEIFREVKRVLRDDGVAFINLGDSYSTRSVAREEGNRDTIRAMAGEEMPEWHEYAAEGRTQYGYRTGIPEKNLYLIPERFGIAMQNDGWFIRSRIVWAKRSCLSGGTLLYARVQKGDMPLTVRELSRLDPKTVKLWNGSQWTQVLEWIESTGYGDPLEIELRSGERIACTPDHVWPTERGNLPASELCVGDILKRVALPESDSVRSPSFLPDHLVGWLIGFYLAEGHIYDSAVGFSIHQEETAFADRLASIAESLDATSSFRRLHGNAAIVAVCGPVFMATIRQYVAGDHANSKRLTNAIWRRSNDFLRALLEGYLDGDGGYEESAGRWGIGFTRNDILAANLRTVCARLGVSIRMKSTFSVANGKRFPSYRGHLSWGRSGHWSERSDEEIMRIGLSRGRRFWDVVVEDEPHTFALASGVLTHNCMPESTQDRPTSSHETIWVCTKQPGYYWDATAVRESFADERQGDPGKHSAGYLSGSGRQRESVSRANGWGKGAEKGGRNMRNVWLATPEEADNPEAWFWYLGPEPVKDGHYAAYPSAIPTRALKAATSEYGSCAQCGTPYVRQTEKSVSFESGSGKAGRHPKGKFAAGSQAFSGTYDVRFGPVVSTSTTGWEPGCTCGTGDVVPCTVLDPFAGSGTTGIAAMRLGRHSVLIDASPVYVDLMRQRLAEAALTDKKGSLRRAPGSENNMWLIPELDEATREEVIHEMQAAGVDLTGRTVVSRFEIPPYLQAYFKEV